MHVMKIEFLKPPLTAQRAPKSKENAKHPQKMPAARFEPGYRRISRNEYEVEKKYCRISKIACFIATRANRRNLAKWSFLAGATIHMFPLKKKKALSRILEHLALQPDRARFFAPPAP
jgi:hypothetical protein